MYIALTMKNNNINKILYSLKFLQFYKEFFEEDGYSWTLQEVKEKLIEDNIKESQIKIK
tara:strand:- start:182 stop:358 length:177 start_codon:yes stop_codon:yes gene_type:complete